MAEADRWAGESLRVILKFSMVDDIQYRYPLPLHHCKFGILDWAFWIVAIARGLRSQSGQASSLKSSLHVKTLMLM
jgi:hypothetical protein